MENTPCNTSSSTAIGLCIVLFKLNKMIQISKAAIKNYQVGRTIPHCGFELYLLSDIS